MITWIRQNAVLASLLAAVIAVISTVAVSRYQLAGLMAAQPATTDHIHDTTRHIDPMRDGMSQKQLVDRLERLEEQVMRLERRLERSEIRRVWTAEEIRRRDRER